MVPPVGIAAVTDSLRIAGPSCSNSAHYGGSLDEVTTYRAAVTATQVSQHYAAGRR